MTTKPRDIQVAPIGTDTLIVRGRSWKRLRFEIEYARERGTTANSYLIQADRVALFDPPGATFTEIFLPELQARQDLAKIDYVILGHVNPNRVETLHTLWQLAPQITFIGSNPSIKALQEILEQKYTDTLQKQDLKTIVVRGEETLDLGRGHELVFVPTPIPRFPTALCTFDRKTQILFTDKLFSAHVCTDQIFDEGYLTYLPDRRYYFDCVLAQQSRQLLTIIDRLQQYPAQMYAPGHGPILKYGLHQLVQSYREWLQNQQQKNVMVAMIYASAYGNTATLAHALARGIEKVGVAVELINCEMAEPQEIRQTIERSAGFLIGSPTLGGHIPTQVQTALGIVLDCAPKSLPAGVFGSYGWSGEAVEVIAQKLKDAGFTLAFEPIRVKFTPTAATLQFCEETGTDFAQQLKEVRRIKARSGYATAIEQAVGRIVGSLCVVTVKKDDVTSAMLASWVSQASFSPPGLTVAVAKDRAIETYLQEGDYFVLNILEQGKKTERYFMKTFAPGEDRLSALATTVSPHGNPILTDSLAYIECQVSQRMECGDHWLVYATATTGKVLQENSLTAIHHRKSGHHY
ncbi:MAG: diflavin flavoprotein [Pseudanabaenaceae cyanobacterium SKYGB_i_bin29]|nr:diflavin flavoprotein [Pseudanabaenaceae cyanobacterium SKYG29]MDW8422471.1 diflavin flavoprotein [Pseudanabaenaceae cyanobacterium SKYGB_i_bin29]